MWMHLFGTTQEMGVGVPFAEIARQISVLLLHDRCLQWLMPCMPRPLLCPMQLRLQTILELALLFLKLIVVIFSEP
jgi:hypothetical protein